MGIARECTRLFGTEPRQGLLLSIERNTGVGTVVGDMGFNSTPSLAIDPTTGIMYAGEGGGNPNLYRVDKTTGAATLVGDTGLGPGAAISGLDFRDDGTLFASVNIAGDGGTGGDHLAIINKYTAKTKIIGPYGKCSGVRIPSQGFGICSIEGMEAIAFDGRGKLLGAANVFGSVFNFPGLYIINSRSGQATFWKAIVNPDGSTPSGGVVSLQFCGNTLFGGTASPKSGANDGGRLITIDPATGHWSFVGTVSATTDGLSLGGLAGDIE